MQNQPYAYISISYAYIMQYIHRFDDRMVNARVSGGYFMPHLKRSTSVNVNTFLYINIETFIFKKNAYFLEYFRAFSSEKLCAHAVQTPSSIFKMAPSPSE